MTKKVLLGIALIVVISLSVYLFAYKGHRDIQSETADFVVTIPEIEKEFTSNDSLANRKYQDKTVELTAVISAIDNEDEAIVLDQKVFATFKDGLPKSISVGKTIKIKGRFLGYDELLEEFKIDQTSIVQ